MDDKLFISKKWLLGIYVTIPISLLIVFIGHLFFKNNFEVFLLNSPENFLIYSFLFNLPHIMATGVMFADKEYISFYKSNLILALIFITFLTFLLPSIIGLKTFSIIYFILTIIHVISQQFGIAKILAQVSGIFFQTWKIIGIFIAIIISTPELFAIEKNILLIVFINFLFFLFTMFLCHKSKSMLGKLYIFSNFLLIASISFLFIAHYYFFVIFLTRIIHDVTAFTFYIVHDHNRNNKNINNFFYRVFRFTGIPIIILCPLLAVIIAFPLTFATKIVNIQYLEYIVVFFTLFHYYTERFVWKQPFLHRNSINIR